MKKVFILALLLLGSLAFGFDDITDLKQIATDAKDAQEVANTEAYRDEQVNFFFSNRLFFLIHATDFHTKTAPFRHTYFWYKWREFNNEKRPIQQMFIFNEISN